MSIMYITMCTVVTLLIYDQICISHRIRREQKKLVVNGFVCQANSDKGTGLSEFGDNQVPHQCVGKGQQGIKPLPL